MLYIYKVILNLYAGYKYHCHKLTYGQKLSYEHPWDNLLRQYCGHLWMIVCQKIVLESSKQMYIILIETFGRTKAVSSLADTILISHMPKITNVVHL